MSRAGPGPCRVDGWETPVLTRVFSVLYQTLSFLVCRMRTGGSWSLPTLMPELTNEQFSWVVARDSDQSVKRIRACSGMFRMGPVLDRPESEGDGI